MDSDTKKLFHDKMFKLKLKQAYYTMEHKKASKEILEELKALRAEYANQLMSEMRKNEKGDVKHGKH